MSVLGVKKIIEFEIPFIQVRCLLKEVFGKLGEL